MAEKMYDTMFDVVNGDIKRITIFNERELCFTGIMSTEKMYDTMFDVLNGKMRRLNIFSEKDCYTVKDLLPTSTSEFHKIVEVFSKVDSVQKIIATRDGYVDVFMRGYCLSNPTHFDDENDGRPLVEGIRD